MYRYQAINAAGEVIEGEMQLTSEQAVIDSLLEMNCTPIRVVPDQHRSLRRPIWSGRKRFDRQGFFENLHDYLDSGLSVDKALELESRSRQTDGATVAELLERVRQGESLSQVMQSLPERFTAMEAGIVKAGEESDSLDQSLKMLARLSRDVQQFRERIRSSLAYPTILMAVMLLSMVVLLTLVVPKFKPLFSGMGIEMQGMTRAVMAVSDVMIRNQELLLTLPLLLFLSARLLGLSPSAMRRWSRLVADLPFAGALFRDYNQYVFATVMQVLMLRRIPMMRALDYLQQAAASSLYRERIDVMLEQVSRGQSLGDVLPAELFSEHFVHVVRVGEETGRLGEAFGRLSAYHYKQLNDRIKKVMTYVEPLIIMLLGLMVGMIVVSMLQTLLSINELVI
jgi:type II secretory pathway component PulF